MTDLRRGPLLAVAAIALIALTVAWLPLPDPLQIDSDHHYAAPSGFHLLGQDAYGRDVLSRLLWGARTSLSIAIASAVLACACGVVLGLATGCLPGIVQTFIVHGTDITLCFPPLLIAVLVIALLGPGAGTLIPVFAVLFVPGFVRVVRASTILQRSHNHAAARRQIAGAVLVQLSRVVAAAVLLESGLSFLGLGVLAPAPSWGLMIDTLRNDLGHASALRLLPPCAALSLTLLALYALTDALHDAVYQPVSPLAVRRHSALPATPAGRVPPGTAVLDVRNLCVEIDTPSGTIHPVHDVTFAVRAGETLAIVGEGGAGKSLTGLALLGLMPPAGWVSQGVAWFQGHNLLRRDEVALQQVRGGAMTMIFQDPLASLNPVLSIGQQVNETLRAHWDMSRQEATEETLALLERVGLSDAKRSARAYPHELSTDMQQRTMIAMAIANDPRLLIADEPVAMLDGASKAKLIDLLNDLHRELGMGLVFISRNPPVVTQIADRVLVMHAGQIVEQGPPREVFAAPLHPYTIALQEATPRDREPPSPGLSPGCAFAARCALRMAACDQQRPPLIEVAPGRSTRCLRWRDLLAGTA